MYGEALSRIGTYSNRVFGWEGGVGLMATCPHRDDGSRGDEHSDDTAAALQNTTVAGPEVQRIEQGRALIAEARTRGHRPSMPEPCWKERNFTQWML
eukprot:gene12209-biopygen438